MRSNMFFILGRWEIWQTRGKKERRMEVRRLKRERERRRRRKGYPTPLHRMICVGSLRAFFVYV